MLIVSLIITISDVGTMRTIQTAERLANLTLSLLAGHKEMEVRIAEQHGLCHSEFKCLRLFATSECLNNNEIAKRMNLGSSRLTKIIDGLIKKQYVVKEVDKNDRRHMRVTLSGRGKIFNNNLNKAFVDINYEILQDIDVPQHESLITAMEHFQLAIKKWLQKIE
jgi:DNA-binding MarR family transcriptional regulator